jgi:hypothetical protein
VVAARPIGGDDLRHFEIPAGEHVVDADQGWKRRHLL